LHSAPPPLRQHLASASERRQNLSRRAQPPGGHDGNVSGGSSYVTSSAEAKADALGAAASAFQRWNRAAKKAGAAKNKGSSGVEVGGGSADNVSADGPPADMPLPADDPLVEAVRRDYNAWTGYKRNGRLPARLYSDGMDLSAITRRRDGNNTWLDYLTPFDRTRALAVRDASKEYVRLGLNRPETRDAWLAGADADADAKNPEPQRSAWATGNKKSKETVTQQQQQQQQQQPPPQPNNAAPDAAGVAAASSETRQAKFARLQTAYNTHQSLYQAAKRAQRQGLPRAAATAAATPPPQRPPWAWEQFLLPYQRARAAAVRELYYEFKELGLENAARRDAWLADAGEEGRAARLRRYEQLHAAYLERPRLYIAAMSRKKRLEAGGSKMGGADDVSWMQHLTEREKEQAETARRAVDEYRSLGLSRKARRDAWLVEVPDAVAERQAKLEALLRGIDEYSRLKARAKARRAKHSTGHGATTKIERKGKQAKGASEQDDTVDGEGSDDMLHGLPRNLDTAEASDTDQKTGKRGKELLGIKKTR
jgi:hypothetical protein